MRRSAGTQFNGLCGRHGLPHYLSKEWAEKWLDFEVHFIRYGTAFRQGKNTTFQVVEEDTRGRAWKLKYIHASHGTDAACATNGMGLRSPVRRTANMTFCSKALYYLIATLLK